MKVTTTTNTKDLVKQIIIDGEIKRFTAEETLTAIHQRGIKCGLTRLKQLKKEIKQDARDWITNLAKERNEYIALYKQELILSEYVSRSYGKYTTNKIQSQL